MVASRAIKYRLAGIGREVTQMTVYETIMVVLGVIGSLISLGMLIVALLNFLDKRNNKRK